MEAGRWALSFSEFSTQCMCGVPNCCLASICKRLRAHIRANAVRLHRSAAFLQGAFADGEDTFLFGSTRNTCTCAGNEADVADLMSVSEAEVGITLYANGMPGFTGILKHRCSIQQKQGMQQGMHG